MTVINPLQLSLLEKTAEDARHLLDVAFNRKWTMHGEACENEGVRFVPLPTTTFGTWHEIALIEIKKLGIALARHTGQDNLRLLNTYSKGSQFCS